MMFKLQKPLAGGAEILAYNRTRSISLFLKPNATLLRLFGPSVKIFVEATRTGETLSIDHVVSRDPGW